MHCFRILRVVVAFVVLSGCSATENNPTSTSQPPTPTGAPAAPSTVPSTTPTVVKGTQVITVDPWAQEVLETPVPVVSLAPSEDNWCDVSRVTNRSDAYMCVYKRAQGHAPDALCIRNARAAEEYACLEQDLNWQIIRGIRFKGIEPSRRQGVQGEYVYLKLTDGTVCARDSKSGMEPVGDYVFLGFCDDGTSYYTRFTTPDPPSDASSPFGEGTDAQGRWLVKTGAATPGQLITRSVDAAYR